MSVELRVEPEDDGGRLDVVLVRRVPGMSRAKARRMIEVGDVRVNGRRARKGARLATGDTVVLEAAPDPTEFHAAPAPHLPLVVHFEDPHLVIVEKPARIPTHPLRAGESETLAGALVARYPEMAGVGYSPREPGIVHRLDNDTSGVIVAARSAASFDALRTALTAGSMDKRYLALVHAPIDVGVIDAPIAPHPSDPRRVHPCVSETDPKRAKAREARTEILSAREISDGFALLEIRASVAVRHQVRAHLAAIERPLAGDWLYGGPVIEGLDRHFLHASRIAFDHPFEEARIDVRSPLPDDLSRVTGALEGS
jgi:23S rRNA pseudouridine1911/1915/1917 synthase